jgi:ABC-2 type transport system permease protein
MIRTILSEIRFLAELWKLNLASALEYRASFISQVFGMMLNDGIYFVFWLIFFDRFKMVRGLQMSDMLLLFSIVAAGFGLAMGFFGNSEKISELISTGRLDYYLVLPRNVLLHVLASRSMISAWGDLIFGVLIFSISGYTSLPQVLLWVGATICSGIIMMCSFAIFGSLAFWLGISSPLAYQARSALITLAMYPDSLFQGGIRFIMFTIIPAALVGGMPYTIVKTLNWQAMAVLASLALLFIALMTAVFYGGLKKYESGSAVNLNL